MMNRRRRDKEELLGDASFGKGRVRRKKDKVAVIPSPSHSLYFNSL